jgi:hypothetical protein
MFPYTRDTFYLVYYTRFQNHATKPKITRVNMSVLCHAVTKFKLFTTLSFCIVYNFVNHYAYAYGFGLLAVVTVLVSSTDN